jgi:hypothetical protein
MLVLFASDDCCGKRILKASRDGALEGVKEWICPKCGCSWQPKQITAISTSAESGELIYWAPVPMMVIF